MWVLWLICAVLLIIAIALLVRPLFKTLSDSELARSQLQSDQRKSLNIELFEQKKEQIKQDFANGLLDEEALLQAQNEIEHSLIHDTEGPASAELVQLSSVSAKKLALFLVIFMSVGSVLTYLSILPENYEQIVLSEPAVADSHASKKQVPDISSMVVSLEKKLQEDSNNAQGWNMLGRSYIVLKRYDDAVNAYATAFSLTQKDKTLDVPELEINYVEALMQTGQEANYEKARNLLTALLKTEPDNGDALWFMGFLDAEMGNKEAAVERWTHLISLLPANSEQAQIVATYLNQLKPGTADGVSGTSDPEHTATSEPQAAKGPAPGQQLTGSEEENAFIASMLIRVENRVKENPQDIKGWKTLGKSYGVLNRNIDSAEAYAKAVALNSSDVELLMSYSDAVIKARNIAQLDKARIIFAQLVDQNPKNLDALFLSGSLARVAGDNEKARQFWNLLLPQLAPGSDAYKSVERNIKSL